MKTLDSVTAQVLAPALVVLCLTLTACMVPTLYIEPVTPQAAAPSTQASQPTDTSVPATNTPVLPSETALPTDTPPAATEAPAVPATNTPQPTDTPTAPTNTPEPTQAIPQAEIHVTQGFDYLNQEAWEDAIAEFSAAIRLDPEFGYAYMGLGYAQAFGTGDFATAIEHLEKYLQLVPDAENKAQVEADITQMQALMAAPPQPSVSIPSGQGALIMYNCRGGDTVAVDVLPPGVLQELTPKVGDTCSAGAPIFLDPGEYTLKASIAGVPSKGEAIVDIAAGEVVEFTWY